MLDLFCWVRFILNQLSLDVQYNHVMPTVLLQHQHLLDLSSTLVRTRTETLFQCVSIKFDLVCMHSFFHQVLILVLYLC